MNTTGHTTRELCLAVIEADQLIRHGEARKAQAIAALCDVYRATNNPNNPALPGSEQLITLGADGTPVVSDLLVLEVAPMLGITDATAHALLTDVLNLRHRHPVLWQAVCDVKVEVWKARRIADQVARSGLPHDAALALDQVITPYLDKWPISRVQYKLAGLITKADTVLAAQRVQKAKRERFVRIRHHDDGVSTVVARMATTDAIALDAALTQAASDAVLSGRPEGMDELRSEALGNLALAYLHNPGPAAAPSSARGILTQRNNSDAPPTHGLGADTGTSTHTDKGMRPDPGTCLTAGDDATDLAARPQAPLNHGRRVPRVAEIVVHIAQETLTDGHGIARVEGVGPMLLDQVREVLGGCSKIRIQPVIDLNDDPGVDTYEIPDRIRRHVTLRNPVEVFPFSSRNSARCDLDHTSPYRHGQPKPATKTPASPQTRSSNLGPLSRKVHRAKTLGAWTLTRPTPGEFLWTSPMGFTYTVDRTGSTRGHKQRAPKLAAKETGSTKRKPIPRPRP